MKYVILITKHHDGFCLWDSKYTEYDVASSGNHTDVVEAVAKACKKYGIGLGLYYSLWDRKVIRMWMIKAKTLLQLLHDCTIKRAG